MLNYKIEGSGQPLLLIHGFGISFYIWEELSPLLRDRFRLIQIELPGIGASLPHAEGQSYLEASAAGIERVRKALGIGRWHVLSYSAGTRLGEHYVNCHPEHVDRAVFVCPVRISPWKAAGLRFAIRLDEIFPRMGSWILTGSRMRFLIEFLGFNLGKNNRSMRWFAEISSHPVGIHKDILRSMPGGRVRPRTIPEQRTLFIWADDDWIVDAPPASPRDRLIHANHSAAQTAALPLAEIILPFLAG
jgi:pimeloyl-ACP methyl ester carboxylesterase